VETNGPLPVSAIKIDQSFVRDLPEKQGTSPIISAIIGIAHGFGMHLLAEGVETVEQMNILRNLGCEEMQGYLFSHPVPAGEIKELLRKITWSPEGVLPVGDLAELSNYDFKLGAVG